MVRLLGIRMLCEIMYFLEVLFIYVWFILGSGLIFV